MAVAGFGVILPVGSFTAVFTGFLVRKYEALQFIARAALAIPSHDHLVLSDCPTFSKVVVF